MTQTATGTFEQGLNGESHTPRLWQGAEAPWSAWEIGAMVAGFVIFWPIGLVGACSSSGRTARCGRGLPTRKAPWAGFGKPDLQSWKRKAGFSMSGNAAFDDYKRAELDKIEALRRKLEEDQKAFGDFVERLRRAKDQEEFERFMAERSAPVAQ